MVWQRAIRKKNGKPRKQFLEWWVPPAVREELRLQDGSECSVTVSLAGYTYSRVYVLTSGGEFRVPEDRCRTPSEPGGDQPHVTNSL